MNTNKPEKVWRYLNQKKAVHLIETSQLYLRRLDLLTDSYEGDPYEGTPTFNIFQGQKQAHLEVFGDADDAEIKRRFEHERMATFVSCWRMSERESWLMWKQYCQGGGGLALQTTMGRLLQLRDALDNNTKDFFLKPVTYLDHWADTSLEHRIPAQVFVKPLWFSDESEIRLALFRSGYVMGTAEQIERKLAQLKGHELRQINLSELVDQLVLNPFSSHDQKEEIVNLVESKCPELKARLRDSDIAKKPVLARFSESGYLKHT